MKILRYLFMAAIWTSLVSFILSQWESVSNSWTFYLGGMIFTGLIEWTIINWIQKEKLESEIKRRELAEDRLANSNKSIKNLKKDIENLSLENKGLRKGIFISEKSRIDSQIDILNDLITEKNRKAVRIFLLAILETTKKIILDKPYEPKRNNFNDSENDAINMNSEVFALEDKFNEYVILYHELINKIMQKLDRDYIPVLMNESETNLPLKEKKILLLNTLINRAKIIPD